MHRKQKASERKRTRESVYLTIKNNGVFQGKCDLTISLEPFLA